MRLQDRSTGNILSASEPLLELLASGLSELNRDLSPEQQTALIGLAERVHAWARRLNLTGHRTPEAVLRRLVLDALALEAVLPSAASLVDLGSGAGFPGLPLAILRPQARVLLVEARERRHHFQRAMIRELGLANAEARRGRIEALAPEPAEGVVAQALAQAPRVVALARPWGRPGGWIAIPGSETPPDPGGAPGVERPEIRHYRVPLQGPRRTLWLGRCSG